MEVDVGGRFSLLGYKIWPDDGELSPNVFDSPEWRAAHEKGLVRLFKIQFREQLKYFEKNLPGLPQMGIQAMGLMTCRRAEAATDRHRLRARLPDHAAAANGSAVPHALHRGEIAARPRSRRKSAASSALCSPNGRR